jgi:hypothetical protein
MRCLRVILVLAILVLALARPAAAWTQSYTWSVSAGATSYKVEKSIDNGVTWTVTGTPTTPALAYTGTEPGLVLFRYSACNANACVLRPADGLWHNEAAQLPFAPVNLQGQ